MQHIAAVVVTYNRRDLLAECIACLRAQKGASCDILVVNNASTDGTDRLLRQLAGPDLKVHTTGQNLGGAGGFSLGVDLAVRAGYDAVWIMDDDTLPQPGALAALLDAAYDLPEFGWLSSRAVDRQGNDQPMNRQRRTPYRDIAGYDVSGGLPIPSVMASFVSLFVPADVVRRFGLPIAEFFIWSDDWEYTRRISRSLPCYTVSQSVVIHAMKQSSIVNIARDTPDRLPRYSYFYRNDVPLYRREGAAGWLWLLFKDAWHTAQVLFGRCPGKAERIGIIWRGFVQGIRFRPAIRFPKSNAPAGAGKDNAL